MSSLKVPVTSQDHIQGDPNAAIILIEYGDYECPHCGHAYPIIKRMQKRFGRNLGFVFRNFPLKEMHPMAESAAEAAEFAAVHERFWEMHDAIYENQEQLSDGILLELAESLGLSSQDLRKVLIDGKYGEHVHNDFLGGVRSGVNGTPTFFVNGRRHDGPFEFEDLVAAIESQ